MEKVQIIAKEGGISPCTAMFNPKELQIDRSISWTNAKGAHEENPEQEFKEPNSAELSCTLYFDTYETKADVAKLVEPLEKMAMIQDCGPASGKHPPLCVFSWGAFTFQGVIESLSQKYTMFLENGLRVRCEVELKMKSAKAARVHSGTD